MDVRNKVLRVLGPATRRVDKSLFETATGKLLLLRTSRAHPVGGRLLYWFGFHRTRLDVPEPASLFILFVCGTERNVLVIPGDQMLAMLEGVRTASDDNWKIKIFRSNGKYELSLAGRLPLDITAFLNRFDLFEGERSSFFTSPGLQPDQLAAAIAKGRPNMNSSTSPAGSADASLIRDALIDIKGGLRSGRFSGKASVSQGIVLRLLHGLGWPTYDTRIVSPKHPIGGTKADFALCHPPGRPLVLIAVRYYGQAPAADWPERQYSSRGSVVMMVHTDGAEWRFLLPAGRGKEGELPACRLNLMEEDPEAASSHILRYLEYSAICTGEAIKAAEADSRDATQRRLLRATLPVAWSQLVEARDKDLVEIVAARTENLCGYKPTPEAVVAFLSRATATGAGDADWATESAMPPRRRRSRPGFASAGSLDMAFRQRGFTLLGKFHPARSDRDVMIQVIDELADRDPSFLDRFVSLPQHGRTRRYLARDKAELYPGRLDLARGFSREVRPGYWLGTNTGRWQIERIIRTACGVAGLDFGRDLTLDLGGPASPRGETPPGETARIRKSMGSRRQTREGRVPVTLMEVLEVCREVLRNGKTYTQATKRVTTRRHLQSEHTVPNACTRLLGLNTAQFRALLGDPPRLVRFLVGQYPQHESLIREWIRK